MVKDKKLKEELLEKLIADMDERVVERDLKPKTKMVVKAEGDNPEEVKEKIIDKLQELELPSEEEMGEIEDKLSPEMEEDEEYPEEEMEEEEDLGDLDELGEDEEYLSSMPYKMKEKLLKELRKKKKQS